MATPLEDYRGAVQTNRGMDKLQAEKSDRQNKLKSIFAAQSAGLDASQTQGKQQLGQNINRFAAQNRLSPGSGALLKFRQDQEEKLGQENSLNKAMLGAEQAKSEEALSSEIGQREFQQQGLNLAMDESQFNRATAAFQSVLAAHAEGIKNQTDWDRMLNGDNGFISRLFGQQGVDLGAGFLNTQEQGNRARPVRAAAGAPETPRTQKGFAYGNLVR